MSDYGFESAEDGAWRSLDDCNVLETPRMGWLEFATSHTAVKISEGYCVADPRDLEAAPISLRDWFIASFAETVAASGVKAEKAHRIEDAAERAAALAASFAGDPSEVVLLRYGIPGFDHAEVEAALRAVVEACLEGEESGEAPGDGFVGRYMEALDAFCASTFGYAGIPIYGIRRLTQTMRALLAYAAAEGWRPLPVDRVAGITTRMLSDLVALPALVVDLDASFWSRGCFAPLCASPHNEGGSGFALLLYFAAPPSGTVEERLEQTRGRRAMEGLEGLHFALEARRAGLRAR